MFFSLTKNKKGLCVGALLKSHIVYKVFYLILCLFTLSKMLCFCSVVCIVSKDGSNYKAMVIVMGDVSVLSELCSLKIKS